MIGASCPDAAEQVQHRRLVEIFSTLEPYDADAAIAMGSDRI